MATFDDRDQERLVSANKASFNRTNTLGSVSDLKSEPLRRVQNAILTEMWQSSPDDSKGLITPEFDDDPFEGSIGTRFIEQRLHSYLPSGLDGSETVQTFFLVNNPPPTHDINDIDAYRVTPLIPPTFSITKSDAYEASGNIRGFQLALFPAMSNGGVGSTLAADTSNGPIPVSADPGAGPPDDLVPGAGDGGFWTVDYENGIIRFSRPPLNGPDGVMNPNDVFGDINGVETGPDGYGTVTMFATYYKYTGEFGTLANLSFVTVGDGYVSNGTFEGANHNVVQSAIDSLSIAGGGTVFIKEGTYTFGSFVSIPANISIVGMGAQTAITKLDTNVPAFRIRGDNVKVSNLNILLDANALDGYSHAIELTSVLAGTDIDNVEISDNILTSANNIVAIGIVPQSSGVTYNDVVIKDNLFNSLTDGSTHIGDVLATAGDAVINNLYITGNTFSTLTDFAVNLNGTALTQANRIIFQNNVVNDGYVAITLPGNSLNIESNNFVNGGIVIESHQDTLITNNIIANSTPAGAIIGTLTNAVIANNIIDGNCKFSGSSSVHVYENVFKQSVGGAFNNTTINDNVFLSDFSPEILIGCNIHNNIISNGNVSITTMSSSSFVGNTIATGAFSMTATGAIMQNSFVCDNILSGTMTFPTIDESIISGNRAGTIIFAATLDLGASFGTCATDSRISENYIFSSGIQFDNGSVGTNRIVVAKTIVSENRIEGGDLSFEGTTSSDICNSCSVSDNLVNSDILFDNADVTGDIFMLSIFSGNKTINGTMHFAPSTYFGTITGLVLDDSVLVGNSSATGFDISFSGNPDNDDILLVTNTLISGNAAPSGFNFIGTYQDSAITCNHGLLAIPGRLNRTMVNGNFSGDGGSATIFGDGDNAAGGVVILESIIANNHFGDSLIINPTDGDGVVFRNSQLINNIVEGGGDLIVGANTNTSFTFDESIVAFNNVEDDIQFGGTATATPDVVTQFNSMFFGNIMGAAGFFDFHGKVDGCIVSGNIGTRDGSTIIEFNDSLENTIVSNNSVEDLTFLATASASALRVSIVGNSTADINFLTPSIAKCIVSGNICETSLSVGGSTVPVSNSVISNNIAETYSHGVLNNTSLSGNIFASASILQSHSLHVPDGYVTVDPRNNFNVGTTVQGNSDDVLYIAVGTNSGATLGRSVYSANGKNWTSSGDILGTDTVEIAYNGRDLWVAVGDNGMSSFSSDGINWSSAVDILTGSDIHHVAHDGKGLWVAGGALGKTTTSADGINWSGPITISGFNTINAVAHDGKNLWVVGAINGTAAYSSDGKIWTSSGDIMAGGDIVAIAHDGRGLWVAVGESGKSTYSNDGKSWSPPVNILSGVSINGIAHDGNNLWVAVGNSGLSTHSADGKFWTTPTNILTSSIIFTVAHDGKGLWTAGGFSGKYVFSIDGANWSDPATITPSGTDIIRSIAILHGSNAGLIGYGSPFNGHGVIGIGDGYKGIGVLGIANGDGYAPGVRGIGGSRGGAGVEGLGSGDGYGVIGVGGPGNGTGVIGIGSGDGYGLYAKNDTGGHSLLVEGEEKKAALVITPIKHTVPTLGVDNGHIWTTEAGGIYYGLEGNRNSRLNLAFSFAGEDGDDEIIFPDIGGGSPNTFATTYRTPPLVDGNVIDVHIAGRIEIGGTTAFIDLNGFGGGAIGIVRGGADPPTTGDGWVIKARGVVNGPANKIITSFETWIGAKDDAAEANRAHKFDIVEGTINLAAGMGISIDGSGSIKGVEPTGRLQVFTVEIR